MALENELANRLKTVSNMINMGEKIRWGEETALMDEAASELERKDKIIGALVISMGQYVEAIGIMHEAMKDGINVHGALSGFSAAEEMLTAAMEDAGENLMPGMIPSNPQ